MNQTSPGSYVISQNIQVGQVLKQVNKFKFLM